MSEFKTDKLILCEGKDDESFFKELIAQGRIQPFDIWCPSNNDKDRPSDGGIDRFGTTIGGLPGITGFVAGIKKVVLIADSDESPAATFRKLKKQQTIGNRALRESNQPEWPIPGAPDYAADGTVQVRWRLMPRNDAGGALETLLWTHVAATKEEQATCIVAAAECIGASAWPIQKRHKALIRSYLSMTNKRNPNAGVGIIWKLVPKPLDVAHETYSDLADFLNAI